MPLGQSSNSNPISSTSAGRVIEVLRYFVSEMRSKASSLIGSGAFDLYNFSVFVTAVEAFAIQFRLPDMALVLFRKSEGQDCIEIAADLPISRAGKDLPALVQPYRQIKIYSRWRGGVSPLSDLLLDTAQRFIRGAMNIALQNKSGFEILSPSQEIAIYRYMGALESMQVSREVQREVTLSERRSPQTYSPIQLFEGTGRRRTVFAARFPEIKGPQTETFEGKLLAAQEGEGRPWYTTKNFSRFRLRDSDLVVFSSGLLVVNVPHKDVALKVLNGALASADYSGIPCFPTTEWDMGSVELSETGTIVSSSGRAYPSRRGGTQRVGESALNEWLEFLRKTRIDEELLDQMQLRHGAEVYYDSGEYLAAFTLAWMVVEREIQRIWGATIDAKGIPPKRKLKLVRENEFNANQLVEVCQLLGKVNEQLYSEIQKLRRIRNDVVHRAVVPTQEQCGRCIATATTLLRERLLETGQ